MVPRHAVANFQGGQFYDIQFKEEVKVALIQHSPLPNINQRFLLEVCTLVTHSNYVIAIHLGPHAGRLRK
jgi:hypothetical protein